MDERPSPSGMLVQKDRDFLRGEIEYKGRQGVFERKKSIRNRFKNTILDFTVLLNNMEREDRVELADELATLPAKGVLGGGYAIESVADMIGFLYLLEDDTEAFEATLREGIMRGCRRRGDRVGRIDIDIDIHAHEAINPDRVLQLAGEGRIFDLNLAEQFWLTRCLVATKTLPMEQLIAELEESGFPPVEGKATDQIAARVLGAELEHEPIPDLEEEDKPDDEDDE